MSLVDRFLNLFRRYREAVDGHAWQDEIIKDLTAKNDALQGRVLLLQVQAETGAEAFGDVRIRLEDEVREKEQLLSEMTKAAADARKETIETHRKYADYLAFNLNRRPVFEAYSGPAASEAPIPITSGRIHASDMVREMTQKAVERDVARQAEAREMLKKQEADARLKAKAEAGKAS